MNPEGISPNALNIIQRFSEDLRKEEGIAVTVIINYNKSALDDDMERKLNMIAEVLENYYQDEFVGQRLKNKCRKYEFVELRMIFAKISYDLELKSTLAAKKIDGQHSNILYLKNKANTLLDSEVSLQKLLNYAIDKLRNIPEFKNERFLQPRNAA